MMGFLQEERLRRYLEALEEERRKIQMFRRELPLCCELVTQAIQSYRQQMVCDEQTSNSLPILEEFMPINRTRDDDEEEEEEGEEESSKDVKSSGGDDRHRDEKKLDWLQSVQLWSQDPDPPKEQAKAQKPVALEAQKVKGAFHPFRRDSKCAAPDVEPKPTPTSTPTPPPPPPAASSTADTGGSGGDRHEKEGCSSRKPRRCWSPELHRRFLNALQQLGGSHVATPKQIRELMKVDGLTNDEVKSHLQKYRLHTRRPSPPVPASNGGGKQTPQFILVGGLWVPPPPPSAATAVAAKPATESPAGPTGRIYAPVASMPERPTTCDNNSDRDGGSSNNSGEGDRANSNSPATPSSSLTVTASPRS